MHAPSRYLLPILCALLCAFALMPLATRAHTTLADSSPKNNATLAQSPPTIEIQFRDPAKLTAVVAVGEDKTQRKLGFAASDKPNSFVIADPALTRGRNEIKWTALSHDGHVIRGTLVFTIDAGDNKR